MCVCVCVRALVLGVRDLSISLCTPYIFTTHSCFISFASFYIHIYLIEEQFSFISFTCMYRHSFAWVVVVDDDDASSAGFVVVLLFVQISQTSL